MHQALCQTLHTHILLHPHSHTLQEVLLFPFNRLKNRQKRFTVTGPSWKVGFCLNCCQGAVWLQKGLCTIRKERRDSYTGCAPGGELQRANRKDIRDQLTILPSWRGRCCFIAWGDPHHNTQLSCTGVKARHLRIIYSRTPPSIQNTPYTIYLTRAYLPYTYML